jgi:secreted Zn-dependent insulinase-like peptidase
MFCLVPKRKAKNQNKPNVLFGTQAQSKKPKEAKRKAKNQRKERLQPLLFPEENPFVRPSVRPSQSKKPEEGEAPTSSLS